MSKNRNRLANRAALIVTAGGGLAVSVGVPMYMSAAAAPLHPQQELAPSVMHAAPAPAWSEAAYRARHIVRSGLAEQNLPGLSVAVGVGGDIVWAEGFGWADAKHRVPVTPKTQFWIGTMSTVLTLTSAAVGVLLEKGRLKLDEAIQTYVPQFPKKPWPVTLRQLMGHVAGVGTDSGDGGPLFSQRCERPVDALQHFADGELLFEPGTQYRYSKYGWILVSAAVEAAADRPFLTFIRQVILEPLGIGGTTAKSATGKSPDRATPYVPRSGVDPRRGRYLMRPHNLSCYAGSMAFLSTSSDLVRFGLAMNNGKLLRPATVQLLQTSQPLASGQQTGYGLDGAKSATLVGEPAQAVGHDGESLGGRVVSLMTFRERGIVVAVMSNISYADTSALALNVAEAFAEHGARSRIH